MSFLTNSQRLFFEANGYLVIENALSADEIETLRQVTAEAEARWRRNPDLPGSRIPEFEQIEGIMEYHQVLFDLVEHPRVFPLVWEVVGPDIQVIDHAYYITPPGGTLKGSAWHTDLGKRVHGVFMPRSTLMVRVIYALDDVPANGGATLVLPGSHRFMSDFPIPSVERPEDMPGCVALTCRGRYRLFLRGHPAAFAEPQSQQHDPAHAALQLRPPLDADVERPRAVGLVDRARQDANAKAAHRPVAGLLREERGTPGTVIGNALSGPLWLPGLGRWRS